MKSIIYTIALSLAPLLSYSQDTTVLNLKLINVNLTQGVGWGEQLLIVDDAIVDMQAKVDGMNAKISAMSYLIEKKDESILRLSMIADSSARENVKSVEKLSKVKRTRNTFIGISAALSLMCAGLILSQ